MNAHQIRKKKKVRAKLVTRVFGNLYNVFFSLKGTVDDFLFFMIKSTSDQFIC